MLKIKFYYKGVTSPFYIEVDKKLISFSHRKTNSVSNLYITSEVQPQNKHLYPLYKDLDIEKIEILLDNVTVLEFSVSIVNMIYEYGFNQISGKLAEIIIVNLKN